MGNCCSDPSSEELRIREKEKLLKSFRKDRSTWRQKSLRTEDLNNRIGLNQSDEEASVKPIKLKGKNIKSALKKGDFKYSARKERENNTTETMPDSISYRLVKKKTVTF